MVSAQGFEPRTHALEGRCSIQLSYAPTFFTQSGADEGSRTPTPKALDPKSSASANSATSACYIVGGLPGNRTPDTLIKSQVLYRLS